MPLSARACGQEAVLGRHAENAGEEEVGLWGARGGGSLARVLREPQSEPAKLGGGQTNSPFPANMEVQRLLTAFSSGGSRNVW